MLNIPQAIIDAMFAHGMKEKPYECCGFLGARGRAVKVMIPVPNWDRATMTFSIGPQAAEYAYRRIEGAGMRWWPSSTPIPRSPIPSTADVVQAERSIASMDPDLRWIIMGLRDPARPLMHAYQIVAHDYTETGIAIV